MITVGMNYRVRPGRAAAFEAKFDAVLEALRHAPGHVASNLYRDVQDNHEYLIVSEWDDRRAFTEFIRSDAFRAVTDWGKADILEQRPQHTVYESHPPTA